MARKGISHGVMSGAPAGLGAFTRVLQKARRAIKYVRPKVEAAKRMLSKKHAKYVNMMVRRRRKLVRA